ncbi:hypothetical protein ABPG75_005765 [Micractinium tetrahymenae]
MAVPPRLRRTAVALGIALMAWGCSAEQYGPVASAVLAACPRNSFYGGLACARGLAPAATVMLHEQPRCMLLLCKSCCRLHPALANRITSQTEPTEDFWMGVNTLEVAQVAAIGDCCSKCDDKQACTKWTFCPASEADG